MQQDILSSTKKVIETAKSVSINKNAIQKFCNSFSQDNITTFKLGNVGELNAAQTIGLVSVFNCINFCFWSPEGKEKWAVQIDGKASDGANGAFCALEKALKNGVPLLDANFLSMMGREKLGEILQGNIEIPLLDKRVENLREAGNVLLKRFNGSFMNIFESANGDAVELTNIFINYFSSFNDYSILDGQKIEFHKRAQLNANMINDKLSQNGADQLKNLDKLTAFADYKVPQILRKFGILEYVPALADKIDSYVEIQAGSREEVEIRATTIWAIEQVKGALTPQSPGITARELDDHLWSMGQIKSADDKPYHRTKTIFY
jgi:hypothetical protein